MTQSEALPGPLRSVCLAWSESMAGLVESESRMRFAASRLPELLERKDIFRDILKRTAAGKTWPDLHTARLFENEILIYLDPFRRFSLRIYPYGPGEFSYIHDHVSWGVSGCVTGTLQVDRYRRTDDGGSPGFARLEKTEEKRRRAKAVEVTLPLEEGIHRTGNPDNGTILMVSIYGSPQKRLFINEYRPWEERVIPRYPPRILRRMLASRALDALGKESA